MQKYLRELTAGFPHKTIEISGEPYLRRYFVRTWGGVDYWLHEFLSSDGERHLHNHPFVMRCAVLTGGYDEELGGFTGTTPRGPAALSPASLFQCARALLEESEGTQGAYLDALGARTVDPFTWHRIASVIPGTWTLCAVEPQRLPFWYFKDAAGGLGAVKSSPRHWWRA